MDDLYLRRNEAATYLSRLGLSIQPQTLARMAVDGTGPGFRKFGRWPVYSERDLRDWAETRCGNLRHSTSDQSVRGSR